MGSVVQVHPDPPTEPLDECRTGAIAQLGERLLCKQEVTGSIPVGSTSLIDFEASSDAPGNGRVAREVCFGCSLKIRKKQGESGHLQTTGLIWVRDCINTKLRLSRPRLHQAQRETCGGAPCSKDAVLTVIGSSE